MQLVLLPMLESSLSDFEDKNLKNVQAAIKNTITYVNNHGDGTLVV
jgi:hypothetical protein